MLPDEAGVSDRGPEEGLALAAQGQHLRVSLPQPELPPGPLVDLLPVLLEIKME